MKILLVEDSATLRYAMSRSIMAAGHAVLIAECGEQATHMVETTSIDMIIMDVEMPGLNGFETTRLIREMLGEHWTPIIFVTGKNEEKDLRQGIDAGGDDYLTKPVSEVILLAKIRAMERIINMRDQLNELNAELTVLSERDSLTKLLNRRTFDERAADQWRLASRNREPISLLLLDIDYFKAYNDTYGHLAGDDCIKRVASAIADCVNRPGDILARYGGEEFIALLPNTPKEGAEHVASLIQENLAHLAIPHNGSCTSNHVTVSIGGAAINSTSGTKLREHIHAADKALYECKESGRNCVKVMPFKPKHCIVVAVQEECAFTNELSHHIGDNCKVICQSSPEAVLDTATTKRPDLVIIDSGICRDLSGLINALRNHPSSAHIPIILIYSASAACRFPIAKLPVSVALPSPIDINELISSSTRFLSVEANE